MILIIQNCTIILLIHIYEKFQLFIPSKDEKILVQNTSVSLPQVCFQYLLNFNCMRNEGLHIYKILKSLCSWFINSSKQHTHRKFCAHTDLTKLEGTLYTSIKYIFTYILHTYKNSQYIATCMHTFRRTCMHTGVISWSWIWMCIWFFPSNFF